MSSSKSKAKSKVDALNASLDELENQLDPLFGRPLADTMSSLETVQQAKLYAALPYAINSLIFTYLKTQGLDPKSHPVLGELERVRQYFSKIKNAEEAGKKRTTAIDKEAAGRFIKHAISQARLNPPNDASTSTSSTSTADQETSSIAVPPRVTEKMRAREEYLRDVANGDDEEDAELQVIDGDEDEDEGDEEAGAGVEQETAVRPVQSSSTTTAKRKRPAMDPFVSMEDVSKIRSDTDRTNKKTKRKKRRDESGGSTPVGVSSAPSPGSPSGEKPRKKKTKKSALGQGDA